jgi:hypothetical protein
VGVHRGLVYLDRAQDDVYGLAANLAARVSSIAAPNSVAVSAAIEALARDQFAFESRPPELVKGIPEPVAHFRVVAEQDSSVNAYSGPVVGRTGEVDRLRAALRDVVTGSGARSVLIRGEAGIGKSTLVRVLTSQARQLAAALVELRGSPLHSTVGLYPVRRLIERRCSIGLETSPSDRLAALREELRKLQVEPDLLARLAAVLGIPPQAGYDPVPAEGRALRDQIVRSSRDYIAACLAEGPAVLVVEDLHWIDQDTVEVVDLLRADLAPHVLSVATVRDERTLPGDDVQVIELDPLDREDASALVAALSPQATPEQHAAVLERCNGVPLYLEQVALNLLAEADPSLGRGVPDSLYESLVARLTAMPGALPVVEAAAVLGRSFDRRALAAVSQTAEGGIDGALIPLVDALVFELVGQGRWRFRHELLREVAAELAPPTRRKALHSRAADALHQAGVDTSDLPVVARHLVAAERYVEAAVAYEQASDAARGRGALVEARSLLSHAIDALLAAPADDARHRRETELRARRGALAYAQEGPSSPDAMSDFERCLELAQLTGAHDRLLPLTLTFATYYAARADLERLEKVLSSVREVMTAGSRGLTSPYIDSLFGLLAWYRGDLREARDIFLAADEAVPDVGSAADEGVGWSTAQDRASSIYAHLGLARFGLGEVTRARPDFARARQRCEGLGFPQGPFNLAYCDALEILTQFDSGNLDRARRLAEEVSSIGAQYGIDVWSLIGQGQKAAVEGLTAARAGSDQRTVLRHAQSLAGIVDMWRSVGVIVITMAYDVIVAKLFLAGSDPTSALLRIDSALDLTARTQMRFCDAELLRLRAACHEDPRQRETDLLAALDLARGQGAAVYELNAAIDDFELRGEPARQSLVEIIGRFDPDASLVALDRARELIR